jgi:hypothetical protein
MAIDRIEVHRNLLARANSLPEGGLRASVEKLSQVYRPRETSPGRARVFVASLRDRLRARVGALGEAEVCEVYDCRGTKLQSPERIIYDLSGAYIFANGNVLCENILSVVEFRSGSEHWRRDGWWGMSLENVGFLDFDPNDSSAALNEGNLEDAADLANENGYFLFHSIWSESNFGHFLHDTLVQASAYRIACDRAGTRLTPLLCSPRPAAQPFRFPMQKFLFERLVGPLDKVAFLTSGFARAELCYSSHRCLQDPWNGGVDYQAFRQLHADLAEIQRTLPRGRTSGPERIYVSRSDVRRADRTFDNVEDFEALLERNGFVVITPTQWTPEDTLDLFANARFIVGIHGAGLMNMMFAPAGAKIVEITEAPDSWMSIAAISAAIGHRHHRAHSYVEPDTGRVLIDIAEVRRLVEDD